MATVLSPIAGLVVPDGEIKVDLRPLSGADRLLFGIRYRGQDDQRNSYLSAVDPTHHVAIEPQVGQRTG